MNLIVVVVRNGWHRLELFLKVWKAREIFRQEWNKSLLKYDYQEDYSISRDKKDYMNGVISAQGEDAVAILILT